ncbi:hypothetical protein BAE44_0006146, partial [Dichanthelium oligosanthes]
AAAGSIHRYSDFRSRGISSAPANSSETGSWAKPKPTPPRNHPLRLLLPRATRTAATTSSATAIARGPLDSFSRRFRTLAPPLLRSPRRLPSAEFSRVLSDAAFDAQALDTASPPPSSPASSAPARCRLALPPTLPFSYSAAYGLVSMSSIIVLKSIVLQTTLLNHILTSQHGKRIAVIENEGVHSMLEGCPAKPWEPDEKRINKLVFIGRNLDGAALRRAFNGCLL